MAKSAPSIRGRAAPTKIITLVGAAGPRLCPWMDGISAHQDGSVLMAKSTPSVRGGAAPTQHSALSTQAFNIPACP